MSYTLGVDVGTFETKGVLVDGDGRIVAQAARQHEMIVPQPGWAEHRPDEDWWGDFVEVARRLLASSSVPPDQIACIAASAIGPCMLAVDAAGRPLMNGVLYGVDTRSVDEIAELNQAIGEDVILGRCGNALTSQAVGPKILWLKRKRPDLHAQAAKFLTSTSYLTLRLTGEYVIDHYTAANFAPVYDVATQDWTMDLTDDVCRLDQLPRLLWTSEIAGRVTARAAAETGLAEGTPVTTGTIDAAAEAVSVGVRAPGDLMMMYGSTVFIIEVTESRIQDPRLWYAPWLYPGTHSAPSGLSTSGTLTQWFRERFMPGIDRAEAFWTLAAEAAASPPGANGLIVLPYFSGERTPIHDPLAKGAVFGLNLTHTRGDMFRAVLEGIAHGTAHVFETYRALGAAPERVLAVGGGTRNRTWLEATSDIGGVPQMVCEKTMGASFGDAFLAACAVGMAAPEDIAAWNPVVETVEPRDLDVHRRNHALFRELYARTRDIAHALG